MHFCGDYFTISKHYIFRLPSLFATQANKDQRRTAAFLFCQVHRRLSPIAARLCLLQLMPRLLSRLLPTLGESDISFHLGTLSFLYAPPLFLGLSSGTVQPHSRSLIVHMRASLTFSSLVCTILSRLSPSIFMSSL